MPPADIPILPLGGVNLLADARRIDDSECVLAKNVCPVRPGILGKRKAAACVVDLGLSADPYPISMVCPPFPDVGDLVLVYSQLSAAFPLDPSKMASLSVYSLDGSVLATSTLGKLTDTVGLPDSWEPRIRPWMFAFGGKMYVLAGTGDRASARVIESVSGAVQISDFAFTQSSAADQGLFPLVACAYRSRVVWGNFGGTNKSTLVFSDNFEPAIVDDDPLGPDGRGLVVGGDRDGDQIVAITEVMLTSVGAPNQGALLVLKEHSAYLITGEPNQSTESGDVFGDLTVQRFSFDCGCSSPWTVVTTPYATFWAGWNDVWMFQAGQVPRAVGSKIRPALLWTPATMRFKWTAAYFDGFYRLMVAGQGQSPRDDEPLQDQWWLDLRGGLPDDWTKAQWWGPQQFLPDHEYGLRPGFTDGTRVFAVDSRPGRDPVLYGAESGPDSGIVIISYDVAQGHDQFSEDSFSTKISQQTGTAIAIELRSKVFDADKPMLDKLYRWLLLQLWVSASCRLTSTAVMNDGETVDAQNVTATAAGFRLGEGKLDVNRASHVQQALAIYADQVARPTGKTMQLVLTDTPGWVIDASNNKFNIKTSVLGITVVTLAVGFYTWAQLVVLLQDALTAALPGTWTVLRTSITSDTYEWQPGVSTTVSLFSWSMLGYQGSAYVYALAQTPTAPIYEEESALIEIGGMEINLELVLRGPT